MRVYDAQLMHLFAVTVRVQRSPHAFVSGFGSKSEVSEYELECLVSISPSKSYFPNASDLRWMFVDVVELTLELIVYRGFVTMGTISSYRNTN